MSTIIPIITQAGLQAVFNASNTGLAAEISHIALGDSGYTPTDAITALQSEQQRVRISGGEMIADDQVHLTATATGAQEYWIKEVGFYLADGTLLAVYSDPDKAIAYKSKTLDILLSFDLKLSALPAESVTIDGNGGLSFPVATTEKIGIVELATTAETQEGKDDTRAVTPKALKEAFFDKASINISSGVVKANDNTYTYYTFKSSGTLEVVRNPVTADILIIAGGGGGAGGDGGRGYGGGGAGGIREVTGQSLLPGTHSVIVGGGGSAGSGNANGRQGSSSKFDTFAATGGGFGSIGAGGAGGSGGGAGNGNHSGGSGVSGQGTSGGKNNNTPGGSGGGGAGSAGQSGVASTGGAGGQGRKLSDWSQATSTGHNLYFSGGGGGGGDDDTGAGAGGYGGNGGNGGGGRGGHGSVSGHGDGVSGRVNTGGGGGGGADRIEDENNSNGGNGGSGIVIVRVKTADIQS